MKYFYTCPIKALYMMKEFGVKLFILGEDEKGKEGKYDLEFISLPKMYGDFLTRHDIGKIHISEESEAIFEPKKGDSNEDFYFDGHKWIANYDKNEWYQQLGAKWVVEIEKRDGKHFFMPESLES